MAEVCARQGRLAEAIEIYRRLMETRPEDPRKEQWAARHQALQRAVGFKGDGGDGRGEGGRGARARGTATGTADGHGHGPRGGGGGPVADDVREIDGVDSAIRGGMADGRAVP